MKKFLSLSFATAMILALALPVSAANFTPSVQGKEAPGIVPVSSEGNEDIVAEIRAGDGSIVTGVPSGELVVTPVSQASGAGGDIEAALNQAYQQINSVETLNELTEDIIPALEAVSNGAVIEDLVVRDLFDVTIRGEFSSYLDTDGNSVTIRFGIDLNPNSLLIVLHNYRDTEWEVIPDDQVVRHENGDVSVTFDSLSPVAFVVDGGEVTVDPNAPSSPQTGVSMSPLQVFCVAGLFCVAAAFFIAGMVKKRAQ